jgi:PKD repeat protein
MMKQFLPTLVLRFLALSFLILSAVSPFSEELKSTKAGENNHRKSQRIKDALEDNFERTKDLALGYPPTERLQAALDYAQRLQEEMLSPEKNLSNLAEARWRERGPNNIGGRTRAMLIDLNDPTRRTILSGAVAGGLWKCSDITANPPVWEIVDDYLENMAVGALAQDPVDPQVMYMGTGEGFGNLDAVRGRGIFRSNDGGQTWAVLPSTLSVVFRFTRDMFVHPVTRDVYAATSQGLMRSQNGGETWVKVLGITAGLANDNMYDIAYAESTGVFYASNSNAVWRSPSGNPGSWQNISTAATGFPNNLSRVEMTVSQSNPDVLYIIGNVDGGASNVFVTTNGGQTWVQRARPNNANGTEFTNGQAWYDLEIEVDPFNPSHVIAGGVRIMRSVNAGISWQFFAQNMHVDHHKFIFDPEQEGVIYFGNDGGIYRSANGSAQAVDNKNQGYNVTQFYACALHPEAGSNYMLGGTQDNNSLQLNGPGITSARAVRGGDGMFCHIDQIDPQYQMVCSQFANYSLSTDGGQNFAGAANLNGRFVSPSDYDSESKIMYSQTNEADGDYYRWHVTTGETELVDIASLSLSIYSVAVDPNTPNRVYFGTNNGRVYRVDDAHTGSTVTATSLAGVNGTISSIDIEFGNPDHLLITISNYGAISVYESFNGGQNWINVEGNLPDMPVRWGIFNPANNRQALIATEAGVWSTEALDGANTMWLPPLPGVGIPLVRTDMLKVRRSDRVVLAGTHGRGLFTTDVFAEPAVRAQFNPVTYLGTEVQFRGEQSSGANTFAWDFGDGNTSALENPAHTYSTVGEYAVSLTINGDLTTNGTVKVLPDRPLAYVPGAPAYGGDFEGFTEQYAVHTISGSSFERGKSVIAKKDGTRSGENAFVLGLNEEFYQANTYSLLYLPNFDFSDTTLYQFSFWGKWEIHNGFDGFRVEYSLDRGKNWAALGDQTLPNWYNFRNTNLNGVAFPVGSSYFTASRTNWTEYRLNISELAGQPNVAFRFAFLSDGTGNHTGVAIDDVRITKYDGELVTKLINFRGSFPNTTEIKLDWGTEIEYYCRNFEVERSINGRDFERIATVNATGILTEEFQSYSSTSLGLRNLYFFRLRVINENQPTGYDYVFYSPTIVMQRSQPATVVNRVFPSPFSNNIGVTFNGIIDGMVEYELFDMAGRLVLKGRKADPGGFLSIDTGNHLAKGAYVLRLKVGEAAFETFKIAGGWQ